MAGPQLYSDHIQVEQLVDKPLGVEAGIKVVVVEDKVVDYLALEEVWDCSLVRVALEVGHLL